MIDTSAQSQYGSSNAMIRSGRAPIHHRWKEPKRFPHPWK
jgi:hypothetical protein